MGQHRDQTDKGSVADRCKYLLMAELARELGVSVAPSTVLCWVVRYVPEFEKCWQAYERPVGDRSEERRVGKECA